MWAAFIRRPLPLLAALCALLFLPGLGAVHLFDWDEINFAEIAREMLVTGNWSQPTIDYAPFHEKPPLFIWLQAMSMSLFGVNEFAARFPNALCGLVTLLVLVRLGTRWRSDRFGVLWAAAYLGSVLPQLYFRSGIIDPWFNLFIFLGFAATWTSSVHAGTPDPLRNRSAWWAGIWYGLAILTKGPVGILLPGLAVLVLALLDRGRSLPHFTRLLRIVGTTLLVPALWFGYDMLLNGPDFIVGFFWRQVAMLTTEDAGHGGFFGYHFVVLLIGCFPASVFAVVELIGGKDHDNTERMRRRWMIVLLSVVVVLFSLVQTKIVHYSSLAYFPLTYIAALTLDRLWQGGHAPFWGRVLLGVIGSLFAVVTLALPILGMHIDLVRPLTANDVFAAANLDAEAGWHWWRMIAGVAMLGLLVFGHIYFARNELRKGIVAVLGCSTLFVTLCLTALVKPIEAHTQRAAIEFLEERQGERCHVITIGYKSYAHWFYTRKPAPDGPVPTSTEAYLRGPVDRPVYVVSRLNTLDEVAPYAAELEELYRKNGFVFFRRLP